MNCKLCLNKKIAQLFFLSALAKARVSLSCESACRAHASAVCVKKLPSRCQKTPGVISRCYLRGEQAGMFNVRALGQSAQAEQDTLILYDSHKSQSYSSQEYRTLYPVAHHLL